MKASDPLSSWQRVDAGDATGLVDSQTGLVLGLGENEIIRDLRIEPAVMTPNGDGVHDAMSFEFSLVRIHTEKAVKLTIYDLSGRQIRALTEVRPDPRGSYAMLWFGDDQAGQTVPPGIYLARLEVGVDSDRATGILLERVIHVVY